MKNLATALTLLAAPAFAGESLVVDVRATEQGGAAFE